MRTHLYVIFSILTYLSILPENIWKLDKVILNGTIANVSYTGISMKKQKRGIISSRYRLSSQVLLRSDSLGYSFLFNDSAVFIGNPITFSAHPDSVRVRLDTVYKAPYFDSNDNGLFDQDDEWGWAHGRHRLDELLLSDPPPGHPLFTPNVSGLHSSGDIHVNGDFIFIGNPHVNGRGSATGQIYRVGNRPFVNGENKYIRNGYTNNSTPIPFPTIPTDSLFWKERALFDTNVHIITKSNIGLFPGWVLNGDYEVTPIFMWEGSEPLPDGIFFLSGHVRIEGNPTGNAFLITDHSIRIGGIPTDFEAGDQIKYIAGGDIFIYGGQYIQGQIYTKAHIQFLGHVYIFGAVVAKEGGTISGFPFVIAGKTFSPLTVSVSFDIKPQSCPNPLNTKSQGVLPAAILGLFDFDVISLDTSSLRLNGVSPIRNNTEDVATPVTNPFDPCHCTEAGPDSFPDLTLKFRTQEIVEAIGEVEDGDTVILTLTGEFYDGTPIVGRDCIVILEKGKEKAITSQISSKPIVFALHRNHPNPFSSTTLIRYTLPTSHSVIAIPLTAGEAISVKLAIYDVSGRLVETLVDERQEPGIYQLPISNNRLPGNGIYFYRLQARVGNVEKFSSTRKMILLK
jgi:hypothetical protein